MNALEVLRGARRRGRRLARRVRSRLGGRRAVVAPAVPAPKPPSPPKPQVSVVVAVPVGAAHLESCLDSLLTQTLTRLEVLLVPVDADTATRHLVDVLAASDPRVHAVDPGTAATTQSARATGVAAARGTYLTFVDAQDTLPASALALQVASLRRTGSDFATGAVHRIRNGNALRPAWVNTVHALDRPATTLEEFPEAVQAAMLENRVFRRRFYDELVAPVLSTGVGNDALAAVTACVRATTFDVLSKITYQSQLRADRSSLVQERLDEAVLDERLRALETAWSVVAAETSPAVAGSWLGGVIDTDLGLFLQHAGTADGPYRERLAGASRFFLSAADAQTWPHVRVDRRLRLWLGAHDAWAVLENLVEYVRLNGAIPPTTIEDGRVWADVPDLVGLPAGIPRHLYELADSQTSLSGCIQRVDWDDLGHLRVDGWAFIRGVDLSTETITHRFSLVDAVSGDEVTVDSVRVDDPAATRWANHLGQTVDASGFRLTIDVDTLPAPVSSAPDVAPTSRRWVLHVEAESQGVRRSGTLRSFVRTAVGMRMRARDLTGPADETRVVPVMDPERGFTVQLRPDRVRAERLGSEPGGVLTGAVRALGPLASPLARVQVTAGDVVRTAELQPQDDGTLTFRLALPVSGEPTSWVVRAVEESGRKQRVSWPAEAIVGTHVGGGPQEAAWRRSSRGFCDVDTDTVGWSATEVSVTDDTIEIDVQTLGLDGPDLEDAVLRGRRGDLGLLRLNRLDERRHRLVFGTRTDVWGVSGVPLAPSAYQLVLPTHELVCGVSQSLLERMPLRDRTALHRVQVNRASGADRLTLTLSAPLSEDEVGRRAQRVLGDWYDQQDFTPADAVLFQCYRGEFATDSQLAIHEELWRRGTGLTLWWAVSDHSVQLPDGAVPLLIGSRNWYEAVGSARYLCQNIDFDRFFRKRVHQRYLQTFHGYPFKSMGISLWKAQGKSPAAIDSECERRNADWDSILVPADFCEEMYRQEYRYEHEVLVTGYPRDDVLVTDRDGATAVAASVRGEVLERLGVQPDKTVVLYAPTWRDTGATGAFRAKLFDELDLDHLTAALGDDFTILVRGHNYNLREGESVSSADVVDVTSYPEINDLILAADVAVLDYSSLRFDWGITGKPVLFFVPDLADYISARTALFEYGPTAPGPMLATTEEVVDALHDLSTVTTEYAPARADFNARYHALHDGHATERVVDAFFGLDASGADDPTDFPAERS